MATGYHWRETWEQVEPGELKRLQLVRSMSQEKAARRTGFSANTWARWERGERNEVIRRDFG